MQRIKAVNRFGWVFKIFAGLCYLACVGSIFVPRYQAMSEAARVLGYVIAGTVIVRSFSSVLLWFGRRWGWWVG
jgi:hypothetical protein